MHVDAPLSADIGSIAVRWIRRFYLSMILAVIGGMVLHNLIIWRRKAIQRRDLYPRTITRMNRSQRWQHFILLASFITLVITGFALKYPDSWLSMIPGMGEKARGIVHRIAAICMIGASVYHLVYLFASLPAMAAAWSRTCCPNRKMPSTPSALCVITSASAAASLNSNASPTLKKPSTGLWSGVSSSWPPQVLRSGPRYGLGIYSRAGGWMSATAVHLYEAILTLAIVVWHFYQIFIDPDVYPMNGRCGVTASYSTSLP